MTNPNLLDSVFFYLCKCHDAGFLPDIDQLSDTFPECERDDLEEQVESFMGIHDLSETKVYWEGF